MSWLRRRRANVDIESSQAPCASGLLCVYLLALVLVLVPDQGLGVSQLPPSPPPSPGPVPKDSHLLPNASSASRVPGSITNENRTTPSSGEPLNLTNVAAPQQEPQLSPRGEQPFNGGGSPSQTPRLTSTTTRPGGSQKRPAIVGNTMRLCCPQGRVTRENGECGPATAPVMNLNRLVKNQNCTQFSPVELVHCSPEEEFSFISITSKSFMCHSNITFLRHYSFSGMETDFCVGVGEDGEDKALRCKAKPRQHLCHNQGQIHVNKCCDCGKVLDDGDCEEYEDNTNSSANSENPWRDPFQQWASNKGVAVRPQTLVRCDSGTHFIDSFDFESDGQLYSQAGDVYDPYCLDYYRFENKTMRLRAKKCIKEQRLWQWVRFKILPVGFSVSVVLLSVTLFFHFTIPLLRTSAHLYLICYMLMLLVSNALLLIVQTLAQFLPIGFCHAIGFMILYFTMSTFSWLTVICVDVLQQTRICSNFKELVKRQFSTNKKNLTIYCLFAFGYPLVLCIIAIIMEFCFLENKSLIRPNFAISTCFFEHNDKRPRIAYYDGPLGVLFTVNLVLLGISFYNIHKFTKANQEQGKTNYSSHPKTKWFSFCQDCLCGLVDRCRNKLPADNSGKLETEDSKSGVVTEYRKKNMDKESTSYEEKSLQTDSTELQSLATLTSSVESLPDLDPDTANDTVLASSNDVSLMTEDSTKPVSKISGDPHAEDHKQERPARRQTTSGMRKFAKKDFTVEFWHKVFIFTLMMVCWTTEVASGFIKYEELWAFFDVLNTFQGSFQFVLLLRNRCKRNLCRQRYPNFFAKIDTIGSALTQCFSYLKSLVCRKH